MCRINVYRTIPCQWHLLDCRFIYVGRCQGASKSIINDEDVGREKRADSAAEYESFGKPSPLTKSGAVNG